MEYTQSLGIYSRKSKFTGKGDSVGNQVEMCREYIAMHYGSAAAENAVVYEDEGFSGGNLDRPQFKRMMEDINAKKIQTVVVYRLDRISRNISDFAGLIERFGDQGVGFVSIKEQFDTTTPMGKAMMYICSVFSQLERETIAERIRDNLYELAKTGRWLGGNTPTGYASESVTNVTVDGKTKKACKLKSIPEEIRLVRLIFSTYLESNSLTKTEEHLLVLGYKSKLGNDLSRFAIKAILQNPVYMIADEDAYQYLQERVNLFSDEREFDGIHGIMAYNRTLQKKGKAQQFRPMGEWVVSVGKHEGVIFGADWIKTQKMLENNSSSSYRKPRSHQALLSGLLYCADCGSYMRPKSSQRTNALGEVIYSYLCEKKEHSKSQLCKMKNPNGNMLDLLVIEEIKKLAADQRALKEDIEKYKRVLRADTEDQGSELERLRERITEQDGAIKRLMEALTKADGSAAEDYIMAEINGRHEQLTQLKHQLQDVEAMAQQQDLAGESFALFVQTLTSFASMVDDCSLEEKHALVRSLVKKVVWDGENATMYLFGAEGDIVLPDEPLCENSKRDLDVFPGRTKAGK